jgi:hypothetical protein
MEKTGFIYIWYDTRRKMYYIGCHWGTENDGYICSSRRMRDAYRRRSSDFKRRIIKKNIEKKLLLEEEYKWLQLISDEELGKKYYNLSKKHFGHWYQDVNKISTIVEKRKKTLETSEAWQRFVQSQKGKVLSEETKEKLRKKAILQFSDSENRKKAGKANVGKTPYMAGKKHSEESRQKMSKSLKGNIPWNKGRTDLPKHSEETKQKMRGPRGPQKNPKQKKEV